MSQAAIMPSALPNAPALDGSLRDYLETNADIVTHIKKPVSIDDIGALSAQSDVPIVFDNIIEKPGFRLCDILVKNRTTQARALGVAPADYLKALAFRLRQPPRGFRLVKTGPVKEIINTGGQVDWTTLPIPKHKDADAWPYVTAMNIIRDPQTGFYNSCHAGTHAVGPRRGLISFVTPHSHTIMRKYLAMGKHSMPIAFVFGLPPAYEIMANFSGLHMDMWGEMEMVGTIMDRDIEMVPCETIDLNVPAQAEIVVEGIVKLDDRFRVGEVTSPSMYHLPHYEDLPEVEITAITMRADRPIYRNHQTCPDTDHQTLPRLCHEAVLYNRLSEIGLDVKDVRFPPWGAALSCILQFDYPREGMVNDALMLAMGAPWLNTKFVVAVSPDTNVDDAGDVYHAIATRCDPARDVIIVPNTRGSPYDPSARLLEGQYPWRIVGKMGVDATRKSRHDPHDFDRAWPKNWGKVRLIDYL
ncbi:MAG TPA: UbiD family decarboxylase [Xanthobacteraceae bacterium]|nr:UbiD family decarboxylase [Xanthobacteraceae bacterium]